MVLGAIFLYLQKGPEEDFYSLNSSSFIPVLQNIEYRGFTYSVSYTSTDYSEGLLLFVMFGWNSKCVNQSCLI